MELTILACFVAYTALLFAVMWLTGRRGARGNEAFFRAGRRSPWPVVAYGMIGASLSGVTFMSVPGGVYSGGWTYMPLVLGYVLGYAVIALVLLPLYYRLNLTSIYSYLDQRFGLRSERTGALFFIISRLLGSALRMYLVVFVLYEFVFRAWGVPFWVPAVVFIAIILLYTFRGGIKTVVWTDMLQTTFLLLAAAATVAAILNRLDLGLGQVLQLSADSGHTHIWETDPTAPKYYWKQLLSGMFITITMTGLDQDMMQKNLTCKSLRDAQKNVMTSSVLFVVVNLLFLSLGSALMVAAGYSSADGTLTALTTTFCYDFLHFGKRTSEGDTNSTKSQHSELRIRRLVHIGFALLYLLVIIAFRPFHQQSLIDTLFDVAGFTYGPLLGLYAFGLFTRLRARDSWVPFIAVASPIACYILKLYSPQWFGYHFGFEILLVKRPRPPPTEEP